MCLFLYQVVLITRGFSSQQSLDRFFLLLTKAMLYRFSPLGASLLLLRDNAPCLSCLKIKSNRLFL